MKYFNVVVVAVGIAAMVGIVEHVRVVAPTLNPSDPGQIIYQSRDWWSGKPVSAKLPKVWQGGKMTIEAVADPILGVQYHIVNDLTVDQADLSVVK